MTYPDDTPTDRPLIVDTRGSDVTGLWPGGKVYTPVGDFGDVPSPQERPDLWRESSGWDLVAQVDAEGVERVPSRVPFRIVHVDCPHCGHSHPVLCLPGDWRGELVALPEELARELQRYLSSAGVDAAAD